MLLAFSSVHKYSFTEEFSLGDGQVVPLSFFFGDFFFLDSSVLSISVLEFNVNSLLIDKSGF